MTSVIYYLHRGCGLCKAFSESLQPEIVHWIQNDDDITDEVRRAFNLYNVTTVKAFFDEVPFPHTVASHVAYAKLRFADGR